MSTRIVNLKGGAALCGKTAASTKVNGKMDSQMEEASYCWRMETLMKENGSTTKHQAMDASLHQQKHTLENGKTMSITGKEWKSGKMALNSKGFTHKVRKMGLVSISGPIRLCTKVTGAITR